MRSAKGKVTSRADRALRDPNFREKVFNGSRSHSQHKAEPVKSDCTNLKFISSRTRKVLDV